MSLNYIAGVDDYLRAKFTQREIAKLHFNKSQFKGKCAIISKAIESLPAAARLRNNSQKQNLDQQFDLSNYGEAELKILCNHFGEAMEAAHPKTLIRNRCDPKINSCSN